jgi:hypothetical protein
MNIWDGVAASRAMERNRKKVKTQHKSEHSSISGLYVNYENKESIFAK